MDKAVPSFLVKLWDMLSNPELESIIRWQDDGCSFKVLDRIAFQERVLPVYFKHNQFSSFTKQLNTYQFNRDEDLLWSQPFFQRDHRELLHQVVRRSHSKRETVADTQLQRDIQMLVLRMNRIEMDNKTLLKRVNHLETARTLLTDELTKGRQIQHQMANTIDQLSQKIQILFNVAYPKQQDRANEMLQDQKRITMSTLDSFDAEPSGNPFHHSNKDSFELDSSIFANNEYEDPFNLGYVGSPTAMKAIQGSEHQTPSAEVPIGTFDVQPPNPYEESSMEMDPVGSDDLSMQGLSIDPTASWDLDRLASPSPPVPPLFPMQEESSPKPKHAVHAVALEDMSGERRDKALRTVNDLIMELNAVYNDKGLQTTLPEDYKAFGCWFGNTKASMDPSNDYWSVLLYGIK